MTDSLDALFIRLEHAVAGKGLSALIECAEMTTAPRSELEGLAVCLGAEAYLREACTPESVAVGELLALAGFRVAKNVLGSRARVVCGDDLVDLVEARRWANLVPTSLVAPALPIGSAAAATLGVDASRLDRDACREAFAVGLATAVLFVDLSDSSRSGWS